MGIIQAYKTGILINNISLSYKNDLILNKISINIERGSIVTLVGPNGCGKTTLLKIINGFLKQDEGSIFIDGENIETISSINLAKIVSHVSQIHKSSFPFSALDVVLTGRMPYIGTFSTPQKKDIEIAYSVMNYLEISHLAQKPYTQMSGGERQMVMIAKALAQEPTFLLLDEPTSFLDLKNQIKVLNIITDLAKRKNITVIMTLHEPNHAMLFSDQIILLRKINLKNRKNKDDIFKFEGSCEINNIVVAGIPEQVMTSAKIKEAYGIEVEIIEYKNKKIIIPVI